MPIPAGPTPAAEAGAGAFAAHIGARSRMGRAWHEALARQPPL